MDSKKANGFDGISAAMLKLCPSEVARPLSLIFQKCIVQGSFPDAWKHANVQPTHKKNGREDKSNYRPISLLCICSKIYEKIVFDAIYSFLNSNKLIDSNQSGFRPGDSTINQLLAITTEIYNAFENHAETRAAFLDMSKAFDKVWHKGLLFKLKQNGISGNLLQMIESYLTNRKQRVVLNGVESSWQPLLSGVPQGSVLGPLLFSIYINDLTKNISSNIKLFADDASLFIKVIDIQGAQYTLMSDLDIISKWARQWRMKFNPDISKQAVEIVFSYKYNKPFHPPLTFGMLPVARVKSTKHLGMILDEKLKFREHILESIEKAKKGLSLMKFLSKYVDRKTLILTFTMHVRPHLEYGDIIFHNCSSQLMDMIEVIQYQAAIIATGCWKHTSKTKLYDELGWEPLSVRRHKHRLTNYHKIVTGDSPEYLRKYILTSPPPPTCSNRYSQTFFPYCYTNYNTLDPELKTLDYKKFKSKMASSSRPKAKGYFSISDRYGLKLLTCLRVGHSDLRAHRFRKNFNCPSPVCSCDGGDETTDHYLMCCSLYDTPRRILFVKISEILKTPLSSIPPSELGQILLYGKPSLSMLENRNILLATIKFIRQSKRFKTFEAFFNRTSDPSIT